MKADSDKSTGQSRWSSTVVSRLFSAEGLLVVLLLFAIALKSYYLSRYIAASPFYLAPASDSEVYLLRATEIARDGLLGKEVYYRAPLYPLFLYAVMSWSDFDPLVLLILQLALGVGVLVLLYLTGWQVCSKRAGIFAVMFALAYAPTSFYETKILATTLGMFLGTLFVYFLVRAEKGHRTLDWLIGSIALGLAIVCRPHYLFVFPLILCGLAWRYRQDLKPITTHLIVLVGVVVATLSIVTFRNYWVSGDLVLISANSGVTFAQGNSKGARGSLTAIPGLSNTVVWQHVSARQLAEQEAGRKLSPAEVNRYWFVYGLSAILERPGQYLRLLMSKAALILNNRELGSCYLIEIDKQMFPILRLAFIPFGFVLAWSAVGIVALWRQGGVPIVLIATVIGTIMMMLLFYVTTRYRMSLVPVAIILAGVGVDRFIYQLRDLKQTAISMIVGLCVLLLSTSAMLPISSRELQSGDAGFWAELAVAYRMQDRTAEAKEAVGRAIELEPRAAEFHVLRFDLKLSELSGPEEELRKAGSLVREFPNDPGGYARVGAAQVKLGKNAEAIKSFQRAISLDPTTIDAWLGIGTAFENINELTLAYQAFAQGLQLSPNHLHLQLRYAKVCLELGKVEESLQGVTRVLQVSPDNAAAQQLLEELRRPRED